MLILYDVSNQSNNFLNLTISRRRYNHAISAATQSSQSHIIIKKKGMNKILLGIFLILGAGAIWFFAFRSNTTYSGSEDRFAIKDVSKIHKIFIGTKDGNTSVLTRNNGSWLYDGKFKVRKNAMIRLLETTQKMEVLAIPPKIAEKGVKMDLSQNALLVRYFDKRGNKIMGYQIAGASADGQGTHILMEDETQPYIVHIPIWEGILTPRFLTKEEDWRDRAVFAVDYDKIKSVSVEYPNYKNQSFVIEGKKGDYTVKPIHKTTTPITNEVSQGSVQKYLLGFRRLEAEAIRNGSEQEAGITKQLPFAIVNLTRKDGSKKEVRFYPIVSTFEESPGAGGAGAAPTEKYFATLNDDFLLVQQNVFGKIFQAYTSFFIN